MHKRPVPVLALLVLLGSLLFAAAASAEPTGAGIVSNVTETVEPQSAASSATAGGSFTTLILNATTQTPRWKAYVGNVTGNFALRDAGNATIYDWGFASAGGEVYASRASSVNWSQIACADAGAISAEEAALNISASSVDSINSTFGQSVHRTFWIGTDPVQNSTCPAIATYVNSAAQAADEDADFQEVLLKDDSDALIFAALIDQDAQGYDGGTYDFQLIVPEDEYASIPHTYYFWVELS